MIKTAKRIANVEEYYFSRKLAEVRGLDSPELRVINLGIGSPDQAPSPSTIDALMVRQKILRIMDIRITRVFPICAKVLLTSTKRFTMFQSILKA